MSSSTKSATASAESMPFYWNTLTLDPDVVGAGTWVRTVNAASYYIGDFNNSTTADSDNCTFNFRLGAGTYTLRISFLADADGGIVDIYVNGAEKGSQDMYAGSATLGIKEITGIVLTTGEHTLKIDLDGQHGSSSDFICRIQGVYLQRTA